MTTFWMYLFSAIGGYLIGSISFARWIFAKLKPGHSPELIRTPTTDGKAELVSHAVGATNVMIVFGPRWGTFVTFLDMMKAFLPTLIMKLIYPEASYHLVVAGAVLIGHLWPIWYRFSGGGGNASIMGMLLAISPIGLPVTHAGGMLIGHFAPMLSFVGGVAFTIPWFVIRDGLISPEVIFAVWITLIYILAQVPELNQLRRLKRDGHQLDYDYVLSMMKQSASTGKAVKPIKNEKKS